MSKLPLLLILWLLLLLLRPRGAAVSLPVTRKELSWPSLPLLKLLLLS